MSPRSLRKALAGLALSVLLAARADRVGAQQAEAAASESSRSDPALEELENALREAKKRLESSRAESDKSAQAQEARLAEETKQLGALRESEKLLSEKLRGLQADARTVEAKAQTAAQAVQTATRELETARVELNSQLSKLKGRLSGSLATAQDEQLLQAAGNLRANPSQALSEQAETFFELYDRVLGYGNSAAIIELPLRVAEADDRIENLKVLRLGLVGGYFSRPAKLSAGFVFADPSARSGFVAESHGLSESQKLSIAALVHKPDGGSFLPVDVSGGAALAALRASDTPRSWLRRGGRWMWPILGLGIFGLLVALERSLALAAGLLSVRRCRRQVDAMLRSGRTQAPAGNALKGAAGRVVLATLEAAERGRAAVEIASQEMLLRFEQTLQGRLAWISLAGGSAALLGFLGTVTGLIGTLRVLGIEGQASPSLLSSGVAEALVPTQAGLAAAALCWVLRGLLAGLAESVGARLHACLLSLLTLLVPGEEEPAFKVGGRV